MEHDCRRDYGRRRTAIGAVTLEQSARVHSHLSEAEFTSVRESAQVERRGWQF